MKFLLHISWCFMVICFHYFNFWYKQLYYKIISIQSSQRMTKSHLMVFSNWESISYFPGTTPGPVLLGFIIDIACTIWQEDCGKKRILLDLQQTWFRSTYHDMVVNSQSYGSYIFFPTAFKLYKPPLEYPQEVEINTFQYNFNKEETKL